MKKSYAHYEDNDLVALLRGGDNDAFKEIYERYWQQAYNSAYKRLADHDLALDIVQEIFCDLWARRGEATIHHLPAYLAQAVKFQVYKSARKNRSAARFLERLDNLTDAETADTPLLEKELQEKLQAWFDKLPLRKRKIFEMHHQEGKSASEIARVINVSTKTVQNQLSLTKLDLKTKLFSLIPIFFAFWLY